MRVEGDKGEGGGKSRTSTPTAREQRVWVPGPSPLRLPLRSCRPEQSTGLGWVGEWSALSKRVRDAWWALWF